MSTKGTAKLPPKKAVEVVKTKKKLTVPKPSLKKAEPPAAVKEHTAEGVKHEPKLKAASIRVGTAKPKTEVAENAIRALVKASTVESTAMLSAEGVLSQPSVAPNVEQKRTTSAAKKEVTFDDMVKNRQTAKNPVPDLSAYLSK